MTKGTTKPAIDERPTARELRDDLLSLESLARLVRAQLEERLREDAAAEAFQ